MVFIEAQLIEVTPAKGRAKTMLYLWLWSQALWASNLKYVELKKMKWKGKEKEETKDKELNGFFLQSFHQTKWQTWNIGLPYSLLNLEIRTLFICMNFHYVQALPKRVHTMLVKLIIDQNKSASVVTFLCWFTGSDAYQKIMISRAEGGSKRSRLYYGLWSTGRYVY